jgi:hypothetical protein
MGEDMALVLEFPHVTPVSTYRGWTHRSQLLPPRLLPC